MSVLYVPNEYYVSSSGVRINKMGRIGTPWDAYYKADVVAVFSKDKTRVKVIKSRYHNRTIGFIKVQRFLVEYFDEIIL